MALWNDDDRRRFASLDALDPRAAATELERWSEQLRWRALEGTAPGRALALAHKLGLGRELAPDTLRTLAAEAEAHRWEPARFVHEAADLVVASRQLLLAEDDAFCGLLALDTQCARAALEALRAEGPLARRTRALFPELGALAQDAPHALSPDYESRGPLPLLEHLSLRTLGRKLRGLEAAESDRFQLGAGLSEGAFARLLERFQRVRAAGLLPLLRLALLFRDVTKATAHDDAARLAHNESAAALLLDRARDGATGLARTQRALTGSCPFGLREVSLFVSAHGLVGQFLRGEVPLPSLGRFVLGARGFARVLGLGHADAAGLLADTLGVLNACDVASVREGLYDDALAARFVGVEAQLARWIADEEGATARPPELLDAMARWSEREGLAVLWPEAQGSPPGPRLALETRLALLRGQRLAQNPALREELRSALAALSDAEAQALHEALSSAQLWYAERATSKLSVSAMLRLLAVAFSRAAETGLRKQEPGAPQRLFHVDLLPLAHQWEQLGRAQTYAHRLLEALLAPLRLGAALGLTGAREESVRKALGEGSGGDELGFLEVSARAGRALEVRWRPSEEARALLTLLGLYETRSSATFHSTLKTLCDLYGLRKDDFDRVHAEATYLDAMNSARSDKARLCDYVAPGFLVEVGPGGGVVLDLLAERFPTSRVLGLDVSDAVIEALEARRAREGRRWEVREGDAFSLSDVVGAGTVDTVLFCSVLHEIYSYVPWDEGDGRGRGLFRLGSVRAIVGAAFRALKKGGRLVIRDGVMPPPGERVLRFETQEAERTFGLYAQQFQGRRLTYTSAGPQRVRLSAADAHAFLFTLVWGAASFPYEVREQYGVETYERYASLLLDACRAAEHDAQPALVPLPAEARSYLQPGYVQHLAPLVTVFEADGSTPARLPDSNALWVLEKR